jgi:SAM-dependent methyltransferase
MPDKETLSKFVSWVQANVTGDEKGQAQIFLDRLLQAFGQPGSLDVGGQPEFRVRNDSGGTSFADFVWKPVTLVEMKKRGEPLQKHYRQAFDYWTRLVPNRPRYVVLCNFDEFRIYDFDTDLDTPKDIIKLTELPNRWGPLAFLAPGAPAPKFGLDREAVTRQAADKLAACFNKITKRGVEPATAQRFILQMLVALFAEDIDLLPKYFVAGILDDCTTPADTYDLIGGLFAAMNTNPAPTGGRYKGVAFFNGGLFAQPARLELTDTELVLLREAAKSDWSKVQPEIFGTLFQHSLGTDERHAFGAHFTHPADIMKIVGPTIVEPWREQIESAKTYKRLRELRDRLQEFRVLDPACGSGNFLYIAYRELKRLEARIYDRIDTEFSKFADPGQLRISYLSTRNFYGLDILPFAVEIAKVTMMIARKLAIDELHITERALPLDNLDANFRAADALFTDWPKADVIIGNPPFLGAKRLKPEHGPDYVNKVRAAYPDVPGMADYCVYWLRKAHDHLPPCTAADPVAGRAGLVGTQNIRNNQSRVGGLDHIVQTGTIIEAVDNQPWSGEANVHVSIANWAKTQDPALLPKTRRLWFKVQGSTKRTKGVRADKTYELNFRECAAINSALSDQADVAGAKVLQCNTEPQRVFNGQFPRHDGFVISPEVAAKLIAADKRNREVIHPFFIGQELVTSGCPERWVIDFQKLDILQARSYSAPFAHIEKIVLPHIQAYANREREKTGKDTGQDQTWLKSWWQHFRCRKEFVDSVSKFERYIACSGVTKRPVFAFVSSDIRPDHALFGFAFADDYSFGVLQSSAHWLWFVTKCSKLTERFRYTPESVFDTFPWPQAPTAKQIEAVAAAGREVRRVRAEALTKIKGGLRAVYRTLELPGANPLKDAHAALDAAVLSAYGFDAKKDLLAQLLALNLAVATKIERNEPVTAPGIPPGYPDAAKLVTGDCIQPNPAVSP